MIYIRALIEGEPETLPFTRVFEFGDNIDENIFFESVKTIRRKLSNSLKINTNECLIIFCAYVIDEIRIKNAISMIEKNASKILRKNQVMIGVPETLRKITFEGLIDDLQIKRIIIKNALPKGNYILAEQGV